jgi:hypothetical protein
MTNRLPFETKAGEFSEAETILQLCEYLRLAAEAAYSLGHFRKANDDTLTGQMFLAYGQAFEKANEAVLRTATRHATATLRDGRN